MKILLYAIFTNEYVKILPHWLKFTASNFYPNNTDVLIVTDADVMLDDKKEKVFIKKITSSKFRNQELWLKNKRHMEILEEYKDKYDLFVSIQSNCLIKSTLDEHNFPIDCSKLNVILHSSPNTFDTLRMSMCKVGSIGYRPLSSYDKVYTHGGMTFGNFEMMYKMNKDCYQMYLKDKENNNLNKVPYHDESYLNTWRVDNKDKVNVLPRIGFGSFDDFQQYSSPLFLVDKSDLGVKKNKYIIPNFIPNTRLGNWLFLIATCYAHARKNGYEMKVPNNLILNKNLSDKFTQPQEIDYKGVSVFNEKTYHYTPIPNNHVGIIRGFFQSSKYFNQYKDEIKELYKEFISDEKKEGVAAIHVRMGDYLKLSQRYKSPNKDFIEKALAQLSPHIKRLMVFSDEPQKAIELIRSCKGSEKYGIINGSAESDEIDDIREMTACEEFIMSCSSFSWWAAYLGEHKKVIVDKKWYNDNQLNEKDLYEESWMKI